PPEAPAPATHAPSLPRRRPPPSANKATEATYLTKGPIEGSPPVPPGSSDRTHRPQRFDITCDDATKADGAGAAAKGSRFCGRRGNRTPTVGILFGDRELRRAMRGLTHERLPAYQRAGRRWGLRVVFFSPRGVRWRDRTVRGYVYERGRYRRVRVSLPSVIHRRIITSSAYSRRTVRRIARVPGLRMFNPPISRHKLSVHRKLMRVIGRALPVTRSLRRPSDAFSLLRRFRSVYIKPALGSAGRDIHRIDTSAGRYVITSWEGERQVLNRAGLAQWLRRRCRPG